MPARPERSERAHLHAKSARAGLDQPLAGSTHAHDLELKRLKGEIPCAECKRLKIKCDRQIPCSSCVRRGCAQLCPNDHLSTGDGTRFASAAEDILRRRIQRMLGRVRALEDALHNEQALVSDSPHDLLQDGDFAQKFLDEMDAADGGSITIPGFPQVDPKIKVEELQLDAVSDAFGTLSIARDGSQRFFGRTAGPTILLTGGAPNAPQTLSLPTPPVGAPTLTARVPGLDDTALAFNEATISTTHAHAINPAYASDPALASAHHNYTTAGSTTANPAAVALAPAPVRESSSSVLDPALHPNSNPANLPNTNTSTSTNIDASNTVTDGASITTNPLYAMPEPAPDQLLLNLRKHLPPIDERDQLLLAYFERGTWLVRGPTRLQILNDLVPAIYGENADREAMESTKLPHNKSGAVGAHAHALLFAVFGVSYLVKEGGADWSGADEWMRRAQAALVVRSVLDGPSLWTLQALHALAVLMLMRQDGRDELSWSYEALAGQCSLSMGLHREVSTKDFSEEEIENRRQIFWHIFHLEGWNALNTGRPSIYQQRHIDVQLPNQFEMFVDGTPIQTPSVMRHSFTFFLRIITSIIQITIAARPPLYREVMAIDREIAAFPLAAPGAPPELKHLARPGNVLYFFVGYPVKSIALICLHRTFFAQALLDATERSTGGSGADGGGKAEEGKVIEPEKGPHAHSFRRMVEASHAVLAWALEQYGLVPEFCVACWYTWTYAFAGALVLGSVVVRAPRHEMAKQAFEVFERAIGMFESAAKAGAGRAQHGFPILKGIFDKAKEAIATGVPAHVRNSAAAAAGEYSSVSAAASPDSQGSSSTAQTDAEEEDAPEDTALKIFGGRNKFVHAKPAPKSTRNTSGRPGTGSTGTGRPDTGSTGAGAASPAAATYGSGSASESPAAAMMGSGSAPGSERARSGSPFAFTVPQEPQMHAQVPAQVQAYAYQEQQHHQQGQQHQHQQGRHRYHDPHQHEHEQRQYQPPPQGVQGHHAEQYQYATTSTSPPAGSGSAHPQPADTRPVPQAPQYYSQEYDHGHLGGLYAPDAQFQRSISSGSRSYQPEQHHIPPNPSYPQEGTYVSPPLSTVNSDSSFYATTTSRPSTGTARPPQEHTPAYPMQTYHQQTMQQQPYQPGYEYSLPRQGGSSQYTSTQYMEPPQSKSIASTQTHHSAPHVLDSGGTWYNQRLTQQYNQHLDQGNYDIQDQSRPGSSYVQPHQHTTSYPTIPSPMSRNASYSSSIQTQVYQPEQPSYSSQPAEFAQFAYTPSDQQHTQDQNPYAQYSSEGCILQTPTNATPTPQPSVEYASIVGFASFTGSAAHKAQDQRAFDTSWAPWVSALADPTLGGAQQNPYQQPQQEAVYAQSYGSWVPSH